MRYDKRDLLLCEGALTPDLIGDGCRLLFVGINPGLQTAMTGVHFAHPSNRFWPSLKRAGIIDWLPLVGPPAPFVRLPEPGFEAHGYRSARLIDFGAAGEPGLSDDQIRDLHHSRIGFTNLVGRATARASQLSPSELRAGASRLRQLAEDVVPEVVAVAGISAFRTAFGRKSARLGLQPGGLGPSKLWVVPNPSGLNAHETIDSLARWYATVASAAGIPAKET